MMHFASSPFGGALYKPLHIQYCVANSTGRVIYTCLCWFYMCLWNVIVENCSFSSRLCIYPCEERHWVKWQSTAPATKTAGGFSSSVDLSDLDLKQFSKRIMAGGL